MAGRICCDEQIMSGVLFGALLGTALSSPDTSLVTQIEGDYTCYTCTQYAGSCIADINDTMPVGDCFEPQGYATNGRCYGHGGGSGAGIPRCTLTNPPKSATWEVVWGDCVVSGPCVEDGSGPAETYSQYQACTVKALRPLSIEVEYFETYDSQDFVTFDRSTLYFGNNGPENVTMDTGDTFLWRSDTNNKEGWKFCATFTSASTSTPSPRTDVGASSGLSTGAIVGIAVGGGLGAVLVGYVLWRGQRQKRAAELGRNFLFL